MLDEVSFVRLAGRFARAMRVPAVSEDAARCRAQARRTIAARVALACARERLVEAELRGDALVVGAQRLALPLARIRAFELHEPELNADRDSRLDDPLSLLHALAPALDLAGAGFARIAAELDDSADNLALALWAARCKRARPPDPEADAIDPRLVDGEHLVVAGHPWHPMCKTRLGLVRPLDVIERLQLGPELLARVRVHAVDVRVDAMQVHGAFVDALAPWLGVAAPGFVRVPVLAPQRRRLPALLGDAWGRDVRAVDTLGPRARPLLSMRTVALPERGAPSLHVKLALDVLTTSARRGISAMSVTNGPRVGALLRAIQRADPRTAGLHVVAEDATAGLSHARFGGVARQLAAIVREGVDARDGAPDVMVCAALGEPEPFGTRPRIAALADGYGGPARARGEAMLTDYVGALAPPVLRLACAHGIALEVHLQNTLVVREHGRPVRFVVRDLGGIRLHLPRLARAGHSIELAPGSFIATDDLADLQAKVMHALVHAHLGAIVGWTERALGVPDAAGWSIVRACFARCLDRWSTEPRLAGACAQDRAAWLAPRCRAKALFRMRLCDASSDYCWVEVDNVLARPPFAHVAGTPAHGGGAPGSCRQ